MCNSVAYFRLVYVSVVCTHHLLLLLCLNIADISISQPVSLVTQTVLLTALLSLHTDNILCSQIELLCIWQLRMGMLR